jgi:hypothetical protein
MCFLCFFLVAVQEYIKCVELGRAASAKISEFSRTSIERCQVRAYVCSLVLVSPVEVMMFYFATKRRRCVHNRLLSLLVLRCLIILLSYIHFTRSRHVAQVVLKCWQIDGLHTVWGYTWLVGIFLYQLDFDIFQLINLQNAELLTS